MIELQKGESISLDYQRFDLRTISIGLGWDVSHVPTKFWQKWWKNKEEPAVRIDLDAIAVLLDKEGKINNWGDIQLEKQEIVATPTKGGDIVYYNQLSHPSGQVIHSGDNTTGVGEGDDEQITVHLEGLGSQYHRVVFLVSIYQGKARNHHFGMVQNAFIRASDATGREMTHFQISDEQEYDKMRTLVFGEVYRNRSQWFFRAVGEPYEGDDFREVFS